MALDLYFKANEDVTLSVAGKNIVHLTGYWEPNADFINEGLDYEMGAEEEEDDEEIDDETAHGIKLA